MPLNIKNQSHAVVDAAIWYAFLLCLVFASFVNQYFPSTHWLTITAIVYALGAITAISAGLGGRCNWSALSSAKYPLIVLSLSLVWLGLQQILFYQTELHSRFIQTPSDTAISWFDPAIVWSIVPSKTRILFLIELLMFGVFLLSLALISSRRRVIQLIYVFTLVCLGHTLLGISAKYLGITLVDIKQLDGHYTAARAWFVNRNHFAAFISLSLVGVLSLQLKVLIRARNKRPIALVVEQFLSARVLYILIISLAILALVLSESRAGFLSIFVSLFLVLMIFGSKSQSLGRRRFILLPLTLIVFLLLVFSDSQLAQRFTLNGSFLGERVEQWQITWRAIANEWLLGYGGNSYADVFQIYRGDTELRDVMFAQAHNDYLHIWLEQGFIGLIFWLAFIVLSLRIAVIGFWSSTSSLSKAVLVSGITVVVAALIQSLVDFNLHILNIRYYFFVIIALILAMPAIRQRKGKPVKFLLV